MGSLKKSCFDLALEGQFHYPTSRADSGQPPPLQICDCLQSCSTAPLSSFNLYQLQKASISPCSGVCQMVFCLYCCATPIYHCGSLAPERGVAAHFIPILVLSLVVSHFPSVDLSPTQESRTPNLVIEVRYWKTSIQQTCCLA